MSRIGPSISANDRPNPNEFDLSSLCGWPVGDRVREAWMTRDGPPDEPLGNGEDRVRHEL